MSGTILIGPGGDSIARHLDLLFRFTVNIAYFCGLPAGPTTFQSLVLLNNLLLHSIELDSLYESHSTQAHHHKHLGRLIVIATHFEQIYC